jgi:hypothetical protein
MAGVAMNIDAKSVDRKHEPSRGPRMGLPTAAILLVAITHIWPWWLPAIDRDQDVWIAIAVGQLCFWPLFGGLVGVRVGRPMTCLIAGFCVGFTMPWYCRWQFGFVGYRTEPWREIAPFAFFGTLGGAALLIVYAFCVRALKSAERKGSPRLIRATAMSGAGKSLALATGIALLAGIPWLCLAGRWDVINLGPTMLAIAAAGIAGMGVFGAVLGTFVALVRKPPQFSWVRTVSLAVTIAGGIVGLYAWKLMPLVRHHKACESLTAAGAEISTWDGFWEARLGDKLEQFVISRGEPFWSRWHQEYVPSIASIRIDGERVSADDLTSLADIREDDLHLYVDKPDAENRILKKLSETRSVRYLDISFPAAEDEAFPASSSLSKEAFEHIAAIDGLRGLKFYNTRVSAEALDLLSGKAELEILHLQFCDVDNDTMHVVGKFKELGSLAITQSRVTDDGLRPLAGLKKLEYLWLDLGHIKGDGLSHLAGLSRLIRLSVEGCPIHDDALRHLGRLWGLRELNLRNSGITGSGLRYLDRLPLLEEVELEGAALEDAGFMSAAGLPWRVKLKLGEMRSLSLPGILQMHQERSRLNALPTEPNTALDEEYAGYMHEDRKNRRGFVESFDEWAEEAGDSAGEQNEEEDDVLVDAAMEMDHNAIIWHQYEVAESLIEAYSQKVLGEPTVADNDVSIEPIEETFDAETIDDDAAEMPRSFCVP